jgi:SAM-dependent methyltransferase
MPKGSASRKQAFETIYCNHEWGGQSRSGPGSDQKHTAAYIDFLNDWLVHHPDCHDIVEIGCGDWATTRLMRLITPQTYTGYDIVPEVIARNVESFQTDAVRFVCADFLAVPPKEGDLLIVKDVLQHLSNASVMRFIEEVLPRYRYALIVNDVRKYEERTLLGIPIGRRDIQTPNDDVIDGGSRPLRLDTPPFLLPVAERFSYQVTLRARPSRVVYVKDVLVWAR